jgi:hypothetical protein
VQLLKVGGRMVYSTCSFNPIENEATVAEILRVCKGAMKLVDVSNEIPHLKRRKGMTNWIVFDVEGNEIPSFEQMDPNMVQVQHAVIKRSLFPPSADEASVFNLDRWYVCHFIICIPILESQTLNFHI